MFRDEIIIDARSGDGGDGCVSFRREKYVPRGGPNGGDGGKGGDIVLRAVQGLTTLAHLEGSRRARAARGLHGGGSDCTGRSGEALVIQVPIGTLVKDAERGNLLRDLKREGDEVIVCRGGKGGRGNARFASSVDQTPRHAEAGASGEARMLRLELRLIADVGLVGLPNAGKSTLLSVISGAHPAVADYPFTTLEPVLGIVDAGDFRTFVVADLPGLVEGAHEGVGLGDRFLRHVERTRVLIHVIELAPIDGGDPVENYRVIRNELERFASELVSRPEVIAASKLDVMGHTLRGDDRIEGEAAERIEQLAEAAAAGTIVVPISSATGGGTRALIEAVTRLLFEED